MTFGRVWYRSRPVGLGEPTMKAMEDSGTLDIGPGVVRFEGRKKGTVEIRDIRRVSVRRGGRDFVNRWIWVEYGDGHVAMFVDGRWAGWGGILGGNKRLLAALEHALAATESGS